MNTTKPYKTLKINPDLVWFGLNSVSFPERDSVKNCNLSIPSFHTCSIILRLEAETVNKQRQMERPATTEEGIPFQNLKIHTRNENFTGILLHSLMFRKYGITTTILQIFRLHFSASQQCSSRSSDFVCSTQTFPALKKCIPYLPLLR